MSNGNIYDPTAQVGTAIAERRFEKTQADIDRRKEWAKTGGKSVWELAKTGSKFQRERMNEKMFGEIVPGFENEDVPTSMYQRKNYDNIFDEFISKVFTRGSDFEFTPTAERYFSELSQIGGEYGTEGSETYKKAADDFKKAHPDVDVENARMFYESQMGKGKYEEKTILSTTESIVPEIGKSKEVSAKGSATAVNDKSKKGDILSRFNTRKDSILKPRLGSGSGLSSNHIYGDPSQRSGFTSKDIYNTPISSAAPSSTASSSASSTAFSSAGKDKLKEMMLGMNKSGSMFNFRGNPKPAWESKIPLVESGKPKTQLFGKGFEKAMPGLQVGAGLYSLADPKSTTNQKFGGAAQVALGINAGLQAFGVANAWNPAGWVSLAAGVGASLAQGRAFG